MKLSKPKFPPKPENRFQEFLCNQPVFNWFDKYENNQKEAVATISTNLDAKENWLAKSTG